MTTLTRLYYFSASHRLHVDALSDQENCDLFGKCNNPFGHGHDYVLSVTVRDRVDTRTGLIVNVKALDSLVETEVLSLFGHRNINLDVEQFSDLVPTTENVALVIASILEEHWAAWFPGVAQAASPRRQAEARTSAGLGAASESVVRRSSSEETGASLYKVHLQETDRNGFEICLRDLPHKPSLIRKHESVAVNA